MKIYNVFACGFDIEHGLPSFDLIATVDDISVAKTRISELLKGKYVDSENYIHSAINTTNDYTYIGRRADCLMEIGNGGFAGFIIEPNEINVFDDAIINNTVNPEIVDDESFDEDGEEYADIYAMPEPDDSDKFTDEEMRECFARGEKTNSKHLYTEIGAIIKKHREAQNITQEELANKLMIFPYSINNVELGQPTDLIFLWQISDVLNINISTLLKEVKYETLFKNARR